MFIVCIFIIKNEFMSKINRVTTEGYFEQYMNYLQLNGNYIKTIIKSDPKLN